MKYKRYSEPSDLVGLINELGAIKYLINKYKHITLLDGAPRYEFMATEKWGKADMMGKDIICKDLVTQCKVFYQVKSSEIGARKFKTYFPDYKVMFPVDEGWVII